MLIVIGTICIAVVSIVTICSYHLLCNAIDKQGKSKKKYPHWIQLISFILFVSSMVLLFMEGMIILKKRFINQQKIDIYYKTRYNCIQRVLSVDKTPPYEVLKEIIAYNFEIETERYYYNSYLTDWFACPTIVKQPLIDWRRESSGEYKL